MRQVIKKLGCYALLTFFGSVVYATNLDTTGVTLLRTVVPSINGAGVRVAQVEVPETAPLGFEVNPTSVGQPTALFTWYSTAGSATTYPNIVGTESGHAGTVGNILYGRLAGVATNLNHVDNYEANYFVNSFVGAASPPSIPAKIANQSFAITDFSQEAAANKAYDDYAANRNVLFISAAANSGTPAPPSTAFNSVSVGAYGGGSAVGPATDGRCKPDITAPGSATSFSAPLVSGIAALLIQGGTSPTNSAATTDIRTIKALLLNGATKTTDWTNSESHPLDFRYGAGIVNAFNSYKQLSSGSFGPIESTSNSTGVSHPPGANAANIASAVGWNLTSITNVRSGPNYQERVHHYYFNLTSTGPFTLTSTLTWNRTAGETNINDLDLFLYNCANSNRVACSTSLVDNVEHLYVRTLPPGRYDLQVLKKVPVVSDTETYALAFEFVALPLSISRDGTNAIISWPLYPDGCVLQTVASLDQTNSWSTVNVVPTVTNNVNRVSVPASGTAFYRLRRS